MDALESLTHNNTQRSYLITYSQVDLSKMPSKEVFSQAVLAAFRKCGGAAQPEHWCTAAETHEDGGLHYHMVVKLSLPRRWKGVKDALFQDEAIVVHFAEGHATYSSGYQYVTKEDPQPLHSIPHPELTPIINSKPVLKRKQTVTEVTTTDSRGRVSTERRDVVVHEAKATKKRRVSAGEIRQFIIDKNIQNSTEFMAIAQERADEGEHDLADFCMNRGNEAKVSEMIGMAWKLYNAKAKLKRSKQSRIEILKEAADGECALGCGGEWYVMAEQVIARNGFTAEGFSASLYDLLLHGRSKYRNILITGPANCGKTFLLSPLQDVFRAFANPAQNKYAWLGAEDTEVIFLNDFRWSAEVIDWHVFLGLLEGAPTKLPAPKNKYNEDITITADTPIFATSIGDFVKTTGDPEKRKDENFMMASRWKVFKLTQQIQEEDQKQVPRCKKCFAKLALLAEPKPRRSFTFKRLEEAVQ